LTACQAVEYALHHVDAIEIRADIVITTPLAHNQPETAPCIVVASGRAAQMYHRGQLLLLSQRWGVYCVTLECDFDMPVEVG
jgi:hypothetical protein